MISRGLEELLPASLVVLLVLLVLPVLPKGGSLGARVRLGRVLVAGFAVRCVTAALAYYVLPANTFGLDHKAYSRYGWMLAEHWKGQGPAPPERYTTFYYHMNAAVYSVVGNAPFVMAILNCVAGALTIWLAYRITRMLYGEEVALWAALLVAFFPSLVLWSAMNFRDVWTLLSVLVLLHALFDVQSGRVVQGAVLAALGLLAAYLLRPYLLPLLVGGALLGLFLGTLQNKGLAKVLMAGGTIAILGSIALFPDALTSSFGLHDELEAVSGHRQALGMGGSAYMEDVRFSSALDVLAFLPMGLAYFFLGPFPWTAKSYMQLMTVPEVLFWYWLIPKGFRGARLAFAVAGERAWVLSSLVLAIALPYALASANMGTAYRHRAQVLVLLLIFCAAGLAVSRQPRARAVAARPADAEVATA